MAWGAQNGSMLSSIRSAAVLGVHAYSVTVEVDIAPGLPQWTIVGMPAGSVKESRDRVSAALVNAGYVIPPRRITVNLAPADVRKEGTSYDLPIALGLLAGTGQIPSDRVANVVALGELGLDGSIRAVRGVLPVAAGIARESHGGNRPLLVIPPPNACEATVVEGVEIAAPGTLRELVEGLTSRSFSPPAVETAAQHSHSDADFSDVLGQETAKRALEIAAAGGHNVLLVGPPGAGKTMLARRMPGILPPLTPEEELDVLTIHSVAGTLPRAIAHPVRRPFRAPHHSISAAGLIGGGSNPRPGEVSLAHHGVLFLDELLEFPRAVLDAMRQPLEDGSVTISRAQASVEYPARFTLVCAMNPCPCGRAGDSSLACTCAAADVARYRSRLSGPMSDRIDMHVTVAALAIRLLGERCPAESSASIRERVVRAREVQRERYPRKSGVSCNARANSRLINRHVNATTQARALLTSGSEQLGLSARAYHRALKVARTIADLDGQAQVDENSVAEALRYRPAHPTGAARALHAVIPMPSLFQLELATGPAAAIVIPAAVAVGLALMATAAILLARWLLNHERRFWAGAKRLRPLIQRIPGVGALANHFPPLLKFLRRRFSAGEYLALHLTVGILLCLVTMTVFVKVMIAVLGQAGITEFDQRAASALHSAATPWGAELWGFVSHLGTYKVMATSGVIIAILLWRKGERMYFPGILVAMFGAAFLNAELKLLVQRARPFWENPLARESTFSFPSGHSLGSVVGYGLITYGLYLLTRKRSVWLPVAIALTIVVLGIGYSRMYLGVHYFSDVIGGFALGAFWLAACVTGIAVARRRGFLRDRARRRAATRGAGSSRAA
jgi:magnesium chelatase family protein